MPNAMSTNLAIPMMSNCDMVSVNVEPPRVKGEPGVVLGVGLGVGMGVGVAVGGAVGRLGGGVDVDMGPKLTFDGGGGGCVGVGTGAVVGKGVGVGIGT